MFGKKSEKEKLLLLLQRTQLSLYRSSTDKIDTLVFDEKVARDLEITDEEAFSAQLKQFFTKHKLTEGEVGLILDSSVYFTQKIELEQDKDKAEKQTKPQKQNKKKVAGKNETEDEQPIIETEQSEIEEQKRRFVQYMPFSNVYATVIDSGKEKQIIALNREFYEPVVKVVSDLGLTVTYIFPMMIVSEIFKSTGFTAATASLLVSTMDKYRGQNFMQAPAKKEELISSTAMPEDPAEKKRLYLMIGVFVVLIGILAWVIMWSRERDRKDAESIALQQQAQVVAETPVPTSNPTPAPSATPAATLAELLATESGTLAEDLSIEIVDASGDDAALAELITRMEEIGFTSVSEGEAIAQTSGSMIVRVQPEVRTNVREALDSQLRSWQYDPTFQEVADLNTSIQIILTTR